MNRSIRQRVQRTDLRWNKRITTTTTATRQRGPIRARPTFLPRNSIRQSVRCRETERESAGQSEWHITDVLVVGRCEWPRRPPIGACFFVLVFFFVWPFGYRVSSAFTEFLSIAIGALLPSFFFSFFFLGLSSDFYWSVVALLFVVVLLLLLLLLLPSIGRPAIEVSGRPIRIVPKGTRPGNEHQPSCRRQFCNEIF